VAPLGAVFCQIGGPLQSGADYGRPGRRTADGCDRCAGRGIGHALMREAERWTAEKGLSVLRLKTNVIRVDAHRFYENMGFERTKTQYTYVKQLAPDRQSQ